jgi:hypothetical protein
MLRSDAQSPLARLLGYSFAALCALLLAFVVSTAIWSAFSIEESSLSAWLLGSATLCSAVAVTTAVRVTRRPHTGGYLVLALVCLAATVACIVSMIPLAWLQS